MGVTEFENTGQQAHIGYDTSKIFIFDNSYSKDVFLNDTGAVLELLPGTLISRSSADGKLRILKSGAADNANIPVGVLAEPISLEIAGEQTINYCIGGDIPEPKFIFDGADDFTTVVSGKTYKDRIVSDTMGIRIVPSTDLSNYDNQ